MSNIIEEFRQPDDNGVAIPEVRLNEPAPVPVPLQTSTVEPTGVAPLPRDTPYTAPQESPNQILADIAESNEASVLETERQAGVAQTDALNLVSEGERLQKESRLPTPTFSLPLPNYGATHTVELRDYTVRAALESEATLRGGGSQSLNTNAGLSSNPTSVRPYATGNPFIDALSAVEYEWQETTGGVGLLGRRGVDRVNFNPGNNEWGSMGSGVLSPVFWAFNALQGMMYGVGKDTAAFTGSTLGALSTALSTQGSLSDRLNAASDTYLEMQSANNPLWAQALREGRTVDALNPLHLSLFDPFLGRDLSFGSSESDDPYASGDVFVRLGGTSGYVPSRGYNPFNDAVDLTLDPLMEEAVQNGVVSREYVNNVKATAAFGLDMLFDPDGLLTDAATTAARRRMVSGARASQSSATLFNELTQNRQLRDAVPLSLRERTVEALQSVSRQARGSTPVTVSSVPSSSQETVTSAVSVPIPIELRQGQTTLPIFNVGSSSPISLMTSGDEYVPPVMRMPKLEETRDRVQLTQRARTIIENVLRRPQDFIASEVSDSLNTYTAGGTSRRRRTGTLPLSVTPQETLTRFEVELRRDLYSKLVSESAQQSNALERVLTSPQAVYASTGGSLLTDGERVLFDSVPQVHPKPGQWAAVLDVDSLGNVQATYSQRLDSSPTRLYESQEHISALALRYDVPVGIHVDRATGAKLTSSHDGVVYLPVAQLEGEVRLDLSQDGEFIDVEAEVVPSGALIVNTSHGKGLLVSVPEVSKETGTVSGERVLALRNVDSGELVRDGYGHVITVTPQRSLTSAFEYTSADPAVELVETVVQQSIRRPDASVTRQYNDVSPPPISEPDAVPVVPEPQVTERVSRDVTPKSYIPKESLPQETTKVDLTERLTIPIREGQSIKLDAYGNLVFPEGRDPVEYFKSVRGSLTPAQKRAATRALYYDKNGVPVDPRTRIPVERTINRNRIGFNNEDVLVGGVFTYNKKQKDVVIKPEPEYVSSKSQPETYFVKERLKDKLEEKRIRESRRVTPVTSDPRPEPKTPVAPEPKVEPAPEQVTGNPPPQPTPQPQTQPPTEPITRADIRSRLTQSEQWSLQVYDAFPGTQGAVRKARYAVLADYINGDVIKAVRVNPFKVGEIIIRGDTVVDLSTLTPQAVTDLLQSNPRLLDDVPVFKNLKDTWSQFGGARGRVLAAELKDAQKSGQTLAKQVRRYESGINKQVAKEEKLRLKQQEEAAKIQSQPQPTPQPETQPKVTQLPSASSGDVPTRSVHKGTSQSQDLAEKLRQYQAGKLKEPVAQPVQTRPAEVVRDDAGVSVPYTKVKEEATTVKERKKEQRDLASITRKKLLAAVTANDLEALRGMKFPVNPFTAADKFNLVDVKGGKVVPAHVLPAERIAAALRNDYSVLRKMKDLIPKMADNVVANVQVQLSELDALVRAHLVPKKALDLDSFTKLVHAVNSSGMELSPDLQLLPVVPRTAEDIHRIASLVPRYVKGKKVPLIPPTKAIAAEFLARTGTKHPYASAAVVKPYPMTESVGRVRSIAERFAALDPDDALARLVLNPNGGGQITPQLVEALENYVSAGDSWITASKAEIISSSKYGVVGDNTLSSSQVAVKIEDALESNPETASLPSEVKEDIVAEALAEHLEAVRPEVDAVTLSQVLQPEQLEQVVSDVSRLDSVRDNIMYQLGELNEMDKLIDTLQAKRDRLGNSPTSIRKGKDPRLEMDSRLMDLELDRDYLMMELDKLYKEAVDLGETQTVLQQRTYYGDLRKQLVQKEAEKLESAGTVLDNTYKSLENMEGGCL